MNPQKKYEEEFEKYKDKLIRCKEQNKKIYIFLILCFFAFCFWLCLWFLSNISKTFLLFGGIFVFVFFVSVKVLDKIWLTKAQKIQRKIDVLRHELHYLNNNFQGFSLGKEYIRNNNPFTSDLDVFGEKSLFCRIDRSITNLGGDILATWLSKPMLNFSILKKRRSLIEEISGQFSFCINFLSLRKNAKIDLYVYGKILSNLKKHTRVRFHLLIFVIGHFLQIVLLFAILLSIYGKISENIIGLIGTIIYIYVYVLSNKRLQKVYEDIAPLANNSVDLVPVLQAIRDFKFRSEYGNKVYNALFDKENNSIKAFAKLNTMLNFFTMRSKIIFRMFSNIFFLGDLYIYDKYVKWFEHNETNFSLWLTQIAYIDAYISMALYRINEPKTKYASLINTKKIIFDVKNLHHPFLKNNSVGNNFYIKEKNIYIVTGPNMAGKSTFLRTIGLNYVLAMAGLPSFADEMTLSSFFLFCSMRTTDDLNNGQSYFNAELRRLKSCLDFCKNKNTLIVLDEILKGTNHSDKLTGSQMVLKYLSKQNVSVLFATHDEELTDLEMSNSHFQNYCFDISSNNKYTYKIARGIAQSKNATELLGKILNIQFGSSI